MIAARGAIVGLLLAGPTVIAFFSGGYFDRARLLAGAVAWLAVLLATLLFGDLRPRRRSAWVTVIALAALTAWTALSISWSPLRDQAQADTERAMLYLGTILACSLMLRERWAARAVEPMLAFGSAVVIVEGLSERLLPGVVHLASGGIAGGRLGQPVTYWNAMGIIASIGFVLLVRMIGDHSRTPLLRAAAAGAVPLVVLGLYLTLSRGAFLAAGTGLAVLLLLAPWREQAVAVAISLAIALPPVLAGALLSDLRTLQGTLSSRESQGVIMLVVLLVTAAAGAAAVAWRTGHERGPSAPGDFDPRLRRLGTTAVSLAACAVVTIAIITAAGKVSSLSGPTASNSRLVATESIRGNFWRVAVKSFLHHPVKGVGAGGFETEWQRQRTIVYFARDAHSLYLETGSELGLVGLAALFVFLGGGIACGRVVLRTDRRLAAGLCAACVVWAVHAAFDWDWEMPAATLPAAIALGTLVAGASHSRRHAVAVLSDSDADQQRPLVAPGAEVRA